MQQILQQTAGLLIGSIPTALLFIVVVVAYQFLVQGPLSATLKRRRELTAGAMEEARQAIFHAEARAAEYAEKLREARIAAHKLREQRLKQLHGERDAALERARKAASARVSDARATVEGEVAAARNSIAASAGDLANLAVRVVLPQAAGGSR
jgi:F-type H+-transporting ATPase subunit b